MQSFKTLTTNFFRAILLLLVLFSLYNVLSSLISGVQIKLGQLRMEFPLIMVCSLWLYLSDKSRSIVSAFWALSPWLLFYLLVDLHFWTLGRFFRWTDLAEIYELISVIPLFALAIGIFATIFIITISIIKIRHYPLHAHIGFYIPILIVVTWSILLPSSFANSFEKISSGIPAWDENGSVGHNGKFISTLYQESKRKIALSSIKPDHNWLANELTERTSILDTVVKRNVHVLVFESLLDPTLFSEVEIPEGFLTPWMLNTQKVRNYSDSPVFGGQTPQAEFEILCGTPALQQFGSIEFNNFIGSKTSCLPTWLSHSGWLTIGNHAHKPSFFNRPKAYQSVGFQEIHFPKEYSSQSRSHLNTNFSETSGIYMYDGDFFEQSIDYALKKIDQNSQTIFNYMLGVYGHFSFHLDPERHPSVHLFPEEWSFLNRVFNQYYYRSRVIEESVKRLIEKDPSSIILVISDHLPPLKGNHKLFKDLGYAEEVNGNTQTNIFYLWDAGEMVDMENTIKHHQIPNLLIDVLKGGSCRSRDCLVDASDQDERYQQIMSYGIRANF